MKINSLSILDGVRLQFQGIFILLHFWRLC